MSCKNLIPLSVAAIVVVSVGNLLHAQKSDSTLANEPLTVVASPIPPHFGNVNEIGVETWALYRQPDQLILRDKALANETNQILTAYREEKGSAKRDELAEQLKQKLTEHFDVKQKIREMRLADLEERVKRLREDHDRRTAAKSRIVEKRFDHLIDQAEGLGWNATTKLPKQLSHGVGFPSTSTASE